jgi:tRNA G46 methylase TrmB
MKNKSNNYWNIFYKNKNILSKLNFPSQFAVFTLSEKQNENTVIEIGCGNGRDSFFFFEIFQKHTRF